VASVNFATFLSDSFNIISAGALGIGSVSYKFPANNLVVSHVDVGGLVPVDDCSKKLLETSFEQSITFAAAAMQARAEAAAARGAIHQ
jgi:hypothetical protein